MKHEPFELKGFRVKPVFSPEDREKIDRAQSAGTPIPRGVKPRYFEVRRNLGKTPSKRRRFSTYELLELGLDELRVEIDQQRLEIQDPDLQRRRQITVAEFVDRYYVPDYVEGKLAPGSQIGRKLLLKRVIVPELGSQRLYEISPQQLLTCIRAWKTKPFPWYSHTARAEARVAVRAGREAPPPSERRPLAEATYISVVVILKSVFRHAKEAGWRTDNPAEVIDVPRKAPRAAVATAGASVGSDGEERLSRINNRPVEPVIVERIRLEMDGRDSTLVCVLYGGGPRPSEPVVWGWDLVRDYETGEIRRRIRISEALSGGKLWHTKTRKSRTITLFDPVREALAAWFDQLTEENGCEPSPTDLVFPKRHSTADGPYLNMASWGSATFAAACRRAGVTPFNIYRLRATCVALLTGGGDAENPGVPWTSLEAAEQLGHSRWTLEHIYWDTLENQANYRGRPIEQVMREAAAEARALRDSFHGRVAGLAREHGCAEIAQILNDEGIPAPRRRRWTKTSVMKLLRETGATAVLEGQAEEARRLIAERAGSMSAGELAKLLNDRGYPNSAKREWRDDQVARLIAQAGVAGRSELAAEARRRIAMLSETHSEGEIAELLTADGLTTRRGNAWTAKAVRQVKRNLGLPVAKVPVRDEKTEALILDLAGTLTNPQIADRLNASGYVNRRGDPWTSVAVARVLGRSGAGRYATHAAVRDEIISLADTHAPGAIAALLNGRGLKTVRRTRWGYESVTATIYRAGKRPRRTTVPARERMAVLAQDHSAREIAEILEREGYRTAMGTIWGASAVYAALKSMGVRASPAPLRGQGGE